MDDDALAGDAFDLHATPFSDLTFADKVKAAVYTSVDVAAFVTAFVFWNFMDKVTTNDIAVDVGGVDTSQKLWADLPKSADLAKTMMLAGAVILTASVVFKVVLQTMIFKSEGKAMCIVPGEVTTGIAVVTALCNMTASVLVVVAANQWLHFLSKNMPDVTENGGADSNIKLNSDQMTTAAAGPAIIILFTGAKVHEYAHMFVSSLAEGKMNAGIVKIIASVLLAVVYVWLLVEFRKNGPIESVLEMRYTNCDADFPHDMKNTRSIVRTFWWSLLLGLVLFVAAVTMRIFEKKLVNVTGVRAFNVLTQFVNCVVIALPLIMWSIFYARVGASYFDSICTHAHGNDTDLMHFFAPAIILGITVAISSIVKLMVIYKNL
jgi:hypothetical protein